MEFARQLQRVLMAISLVQTARQTGFPWTRELVAVVVLGKT